MRSVASGSPRPPESWTRRPVQLLTRVLLRLGHEVILAPDRIVEPRRGARRCRGSPRAGRGSGRFHTRPSSRPKGGLTRQGRGAGGRMMRHHGVWLRLPSNAGPSRGTLSEHCSDHGRGPEGGPSGVAVSSATWYRLCPGKSAATTPGSRISAPGGGGARRRQGTCGDDPGIRRGRAVSGGERRGPRDALVGPYKRKSQTSSVRSL